VVYTANWGIIWYLPPVKGTRKLHWPFFSWSNRPPLLICWFMSLTMFFQGLGLSSSRRKHLFQGDGWLLGLLGKPPNFRPFQICKNTPNSTFANKTCRFPTASAASESGLGRGSPWNLAKMVQIILPGGFVLASWEGFVVQTSASQLALDIQIIQ